MSIKSVIFSLSIIFVYGASVAQPVFEASYFYYKNKESKKPVFPMENQKVDSLDLKKTINQKLQQLYENGFLAASDTLFFPSVGQATVIFYINEIFTVGNLSIGNVDEEIINKVGFSATNFDGRPFSHQKTVRLLQSILNYAENSGYPFASIKLDSISIFQNEINAKLNYQSGPMIVFDSLAIRGDANIKSNYLMAHLGLYKDKPYEDDLIDEIATKLKQLPYLEMTEKPQISMKDGKCTVYLNLKKRNASSMDGILGFLPNQKQDNGMLVTGQVNLDLKNLFASGKRLVLEWQSYDALSQLLNVLYFHPNLLKTPVHIGGEFHLLKQDTTFLQREFDLDLSFFSKNSNLIGFRSAFISSRLISTSALQEDTPSLPKNTDYNLNYYGLDYQLNRLNDMDFPTRGFGLKMNASIGQKKIMENPAIAQSVDLNTVQYRWSGQIEKYWGVFRNIILKANLNGGYLNGANLFQSDMFRLGGLRTLRGFAENQFYATQFGVGSLELRAVFSSQTYFMLFLDQGALSQAGFADEGMQYPFGAGAGMSFATNAGIFNLILAMGQSETQPFAINHAKVHFGYVSRF